MLILAVQHNNYPRPNPRVIPCLLRAAYPRPVALSAVLYILLLDLPLVQSTPHKPQTLTDDCSLSHRHQERSQIHPPECTPLLYWRQTHSPPLLLCAAKKKPRRRSQSPHTLHNPSQALARPHRFLPITTIIRKKFSGCRVRPTFRHPFAQVPSIPAICRQGPQPCPHPQSDFLRFVADRNRNPVLHRTYYMPLFTQRRGRRFIPITDDDSDDNDDEIRGD